MSKGVLLATSFLHIQYHRFFSICVTSFENDTTSQTRFWIMGQVGYYQVRLVNFIQNRFIQFVDTRILIYAV